jgi:DtxR family transcriptional regulator, iron-dependent repressor
MEGYHPAVEEYLETILELEESGIRPMRARIVERLHVSAPAVSETVRRLEREGYLTLDESRAIQLTRKGRTYATSIMRRHRLAERLLTDVLKVPWSQVHEEAGRLEHAISPRLEQHLVALLGDPGTCPHGNPIPGSVNAVDVATQIPLGTAPVDSTVVVRRIDEELEARYDRMQELEAGRVMPGHMLQVLEPEQPGRQRFDSDGTVITLDPAVTAKVYVTVE